MDILRLPVAVALLYAGFWAEDNLTINNIMVGVGLFYLGIGVLGVISPQLFGLAPHGLTGFDIAFHMVAGIAAAAAGLMHRARHDTVPSV